MEKIFKDWTGEKKVSVVRKEAREVVMEALVEFLSERFDKVGRVSSTETAVVVGMANDKDGFAQDVVVTFAPKCRTWYDGVGEKGREMTQFNIEDEMEAYQMEVEIKAKQKASSSKKK